MNHTSARYLLREQQRGERTYADIAATLGVPESYIYKLGAQELRLRWSPTFAGLSPRIRNSLAAAEITTITELRTLHDNLQLLTVPNLGIKSFNEIRHWLSRRYPEQL